MVFAGTHVPDRNTDLIPAALALILAGLASAIHVNAFGVSWSFLWLPFLLVAIWPRRAGSFPSALLLFFAGIWVDWTTLGALGQWSTVFLVTYLVTRPDRQATERGVLPAYRRFCVALLVGISAYVVTGWLVYGAWPDWFSLMRGVFVAALILPFAALLRDRLARRMSRER